MFNIENYINMKKEFYKSFSNCIYVGNTSIEIQIDLDENFKPRKIYPTDDLMGVINIESIKLDNKESYEWDNMEYFFENEYKDDKKETKKELQEKNLWDDNFFKALKALLKDTKKIIKKLEA